jgi:tetratricopeptide (TPR) repeat protein
VAATLLASILILGPAAGASAQHHAPRSEKPPALLAGLGSHAHRIETSSAEAQSYFDQGLTLLYAFNRYEALRSFRKAAELDPKAPMPQWGISAALAPHVNMDLDGDVQIKESCQAAEKGMKLAANASDRERAYLKAAASRCPEYRPAAYIQAMRDVWKRYPDDLDAGTLYAESLMIPVRWKWWSQDGKPAEGVEEAVQVLEEVLRRNPGHPGANHFYIHAVEASAWPARAIPSAQRLMGAVPAAGHLVHMPAHVWLRIGDYELAGDINEHAAAADVEYMNATGVSTSAYAGYYVHNLHFVAYARSMEGRAADTLKAAAAISEAAAPFAQEMAMLVDAFVPAPIFAAIRFQRWEELLKMKQPDSKLLATTAVWHFGLALAYAVKGQRPQALEEQQAFQTARQKVPSDWIWLNNKAESILGLAALVLEARLSASDAAAVPHWQKAVALEDALIYDEPPPWFYPIRESLGGALLRSGAAEKAEAVFREGIERTPRNGRMLFGLIASLNAQKKTEAAALVQQEFESAWKKADVRLRVEDL